jgi:hypothetical protein
MLTGCGSRPLRFVGERYRVRVGEEGQTERLYQGHSALDPGAAGVDAA